MFHFSAFVLSPNSRYTLVLFSFLTTLFLNPLKAQDSLLPKDSFSISKPQFTKIGKGLCKVQDGVLATRDAYASVGSAEWENYTISFEARTPKTEEQVQIWFGFREQGRNNRYLVGFKGGFQNDIEIARMGLMGDDRFLGIRNLDFNPTLGVWYAFKIEVCKNRFRVFINNENTPRIDVIDDKGDILTKGKVVLGGAWIKNEFRNLEVTRLSDTYMDPIKIKEYSYYLTPKQKVEKRIKERKQYKKVKVSHIDPIRTTISLDGNWLFKPDHELINREQAIDANSSDDDWHILEVPNFWNPSRIWLHGETFMDEEHQKGASDTYFQKETDRCENYTFDYKKTNIGWYRQWVDLPDSLNDKNIELNFDAVSKMAEVYVNGKLAGNNKGMFGEIKLDITKFLKPGSNLIAVKVMKEYTKDIKNANEIATIAVTVEVTNQMLKDIPHGFFRDEPVGIWQPVKLIITNPVKIVDSYIKPNLTGASFEIQLRNTSKLKKTFNLNTSIKEKGSNDILIETESIKKIILKEGEYKTVTFEINNLNPKLWSPETPNLYSFNFNLKESKTNKLLDSETIQSGFRTFETKGDYFYLNGKQYWLRGANHTPHALGINDADLANKTLQMYHDGNIAVTRSHTIPYSEVWLKAADEQGVGISYEGTWPWLMIGIGEESIPKKELLNIWSNEWIRLMKKYRNHPSLLYWTINNEMNFTHKKDKLSKMEQKMQIVSDVVKQMRITDPTRPISFDSGYTRKAVKNNPNENFFQKYDDGDIDDGHNYQGWYNTSVFDVFDKKQLLNRKTNGRPLISQEWSSGYPNTETGHHTRSYLWQHQNTQTHIGNQAYPFGNPSYSLENNAFLTSELVEAVRRTHDKLAGMHNFSSITWFQNVYDAEKVKPYPTYYRMKNSLNPILVSAELWGRHYFTGDKLPTRFCIVNDKLNGENLEASILEWEITYEDDRIVSSGEYSIPKIAHYSRKWLTPNIILPENFSGNRLDGKLKLYLKQNRKVIAKNEYNLLIAKKSWVKPLHNSKKIIVVDFDNNTIPVLDMLNYKYITVNNLEEAFSKKADIYIVSGLSDVKEFDAKKAKLILDNVNKGAKVLLLKTGEKATAIFPKHITKYLNKKMETAHIDITESQVFKDLEYFDLRYFSNPKAEKPLVYSGLYQINESKSNIVCIASGCQHRYARGQDRRKEMLTMKGFPIISITNKGKAVFSEMMTNKGLYDPIAAKLLINLISETLE